MLVALVSASSAALGAEPTTVSASSSVPWSVRVGVNAVDGRALRDLGPPPGVGFYKDFGFTGRAFEHAGRRVGYRPILLYQGRNDRWLRRWGALGAYELGLVRLPPWIGRGDFRDSLSLERLEARIRRDRESFPDAALLQLGIEPGYASGGDARSPAEIAADARAVAAALEIDFEVGALVSVQGELTQVGRAFVDALREAEAGEPDAAEPDSALRYPSGDSGVRGP